MSKNRHNIYIYIICSKSPKTMGGEYSYIEYMSNFI